MAPSKTSTRRRPRISAVATRADATVPEQLHAIARAGFASIAGSEGVWHLFPNGIGLVELKATAEGAELFLRLAGPRPARRAPPSPRQPGGEEGASPRPHLPPALVKPIPPLCYP